MDLRLDAHPGSKLVVAVLFRLQNNLHRNPLDDLDVVAGGIFGRKRTEERARGPGDALYVTRVSPAARIHVNIRPLPGLHALELSLFEVGSDPHFVEWDDGQQLLAGLDVQADDNVLVHLTADRRGDP